MIELANPSTAFIELLIRPPIADATALNVPISEAFTLFPSSSNAIHVSERNEGIFPANISSMFGIKNPVRSVVLPIDAFIMSKIFEMLVIA